VYQVAREFRKAMYRVANGVPEDEKFGLAGQIRRAAVSPTNNIAEGHGRFHFLDQIKFSLQGRGSLEVLMDDLNVCEDEQYLPSDNIATLKQNGWRMRQLSTVTFATCALRSSLTNLGSKKNLPIPTATR
jgi:four helix bundle protein